MQSVTFIQPIIRFLEIVKALSIGIKMSYKLKNSTSGNSRGCE